MSESKHVVSFSGGKDSTALVLRLCELGTPPDALLFFNGGWEFPGMIEHVQLVAKNTGVPLHVVHPRTGGRVVTFDYLCCHVKKSRGPNRNQLGYGWPGRVRRWCTQRKGDALDRWIRANPTGEHCVGYAADEDRRMPVQGRAKEAIRYPLIEWGWTEKDCLDYCLSLGYTWGGLYDYFNRVSCFCCPFQRVGMLRKLWKHFPELWARMEEVHRQIPSGGGHLGFKGNRKAYDNDVPGWTKRFEDEERMKENEN